MKRCLALGLLCLTALGCAPSLREVQTAQNNALSGALLCAQKDWPSWSARAQCENAALIGAYDAIGYPHMDLIRWLAEQNSIASQGFDSGKLTADQAGAIIGAAYQRVMRQAAGRDAANQAAALLAGQGLLGVGQSFQRAAISAAPLRCSTNYVGSQAYTNCY